MSEPTRPGRPGKPPRFAATDFNLKPPLELARPAAPPQTTVDDIPLPKRRKAVKMRRPKTFSLAFFALGMIGAGTVFMWSVRNMKEYAPRIVQVALDIDLDQLGKKDAPVYTPPPDIEDPVLIQFEVKPRHARIFMNGQAVQSNPLRLPRGDQPIEFVIWEDGFLPAAAEVTPKGDQTVAVKLSKQGR